eukprot:4577913-Lingulodinium_polyedra.AAC.1
MEPVWAARDVTGVWQCRPNRWPQQSGLGSPSRPGKFKNQPRPALHPKHSRTIGHFCCARNP